MKIQTIALIGGAAVAAGLVIYVTQKKQPGETMANAAGRVIVEAASGAAVGGVKGIGSVLGIPDTNQDQCSRDLAAGDFWAASFSCPMSTFVGEVFTPAPVINDRQIDRMTEREQRDQQTTNLGGVFDAETGEEVGAYDAMGNRIY